MLALKRVLQQASIAQAELARALGISEATMAQLLNHHVWPSKPDRELLSTSIELELKKAGVPWNVGLIEIVPAVLAASDKTITLEETTMLLRKTSLSPAAKQHFKLFKSPFDEDVQEAADVFSTPANRYVREYLWLTAKVGGFVAIVGESGAGKSTLRKELEDRVLRESAPIVLIQPYVLGMEDSDGKGKTLKSSAIADALITEIAPNERPKSSMEAKSRQLHRILRDSRRSGFSHCLIIEEAHALNTHTLKHLKRFLELEDGFNRLLSIILIGQTELKTKLSGRCPDVREVVQRCDLVELQPLDAHLSEYIKFKFSRVGVELDAVFEKDALDGIVSRLIFSKQGKNSRETVSLMYPLMVNNLVTASMNQAALLGFDKVSGDLIREA